MNKIESNRNKLKFLGIAILIAGLIWLAYSYIGVDKATGVPKALLMRIRPMSWEEIYWDESNQLLKLTVKDETLDGQESRCLRTYCLTSSGLLIGGREYSTLDASSFVNARLEYTIDNNILTVIDKKYSKELFKLDLDEVLEERDFINEIKASAVFYELGETVYIKVLLAYRTEQSSKLQYSDVLPKLEGILYYTKESSGRSDTYEIKELYCYED